jgi:hypothetical protein
LVTYWAGDGLEHLQEAVNKVYAAAAEVEQKFCKERDAILNTDFGKRQDIHSFLGGLEHLMQGCLLYEYASPRYHGLGYTWNGRMLGTLILTPEKTIFQE